MKASSFVNQRLYEGKYVVHTSHRKGVRSDRTHDYEEVEAADKGHALKKAIALAKLKHGHQQSLTWHGSYDMSNPAKAEEVKNKIAGRFTSSVTSEPRTPAFTDAEREAVKKTRTSLHMKWLAGLKKKKLQEDSVSQFTRLKNIMKRDGILRDKLMRTIAKMGAQSKTAGGVSANSRRLMRAQLANKRDHAAVVRRQIYRIGA